MVNVFLLQDVVVFNEAGELHFSTQFFQLGQMCTRDNIVMYMLRMNSKRSVLYKYLGG